MVRSRILDDGPHVIQVVPRQAVDDGYGGTKYVDLPPKEVRCMVTPQSASESEAMGLQGEVTYGVITRGPWPWTMVSKIIWSGANDEWPGREWDQVGEARVYAMSPGIAHVQVTMKARTSKAGEVNG